MYDVAQRVMKVQTMHTGPVFDCCFTDSEHIYSGGMERKVKWYNKLPHLFCSYDIITNQSVDIGSHDEAIKVTKYVPSIASVISGGWDKQAKIWDNRARTCTMSIPLDERIYSISSSSSRLVIGTAPRTVFIYDIRKLNTPMQKRESSLKFQTRYIECMSNDLGFVISSTEGHVGVEYYDVNDNSPDHKPYTFKCHRKIHNEGEDKLVYVYPVNMVKFNPIYNSLASCGSDGTVCLWDIDKRKKICSIGPYSDCISSISFHYTGLKLAIATSYTYEEGVNKPGSLHQVHILDLNESQVRPK